MLPDRQQCRLAVADGLCPIAFALEDPLQQRAIGEVVLDDEDQRTGVGRSHRGHHAPAGHQDSPVDDAGTAGAPGSMVIAETLSSVSSSVNQPWRTANVTAWVRFGTPSLWRMLERWFLIVCSLTSSSSPTSRLRRPPATCRRIVELSGRQRDARWLLGAPEAVAEPLHDPVDKVGPGDDLVLERVLAVRDAADDRDQLGRLGVGRDVAGGPDLDRLQHARVVVLAADHDDPRTGRLLGQSPGRGTRRRLLQLDVDDEHVGGPCLDHRHGVVGRSNLGDDLHVGFVVEDTADPETDERAWLDEHDPNGLEVCRRRWRASVVHRASCAWD